VDVPDSGSLVLSSTTTIIHKKYNFPNNDIALIKLPTPVNFTSEYCHVMTNVKIILLVLEKNKVLPICNIELYLFISSMFLKIFQSYEYSIIALQCN